MADKKLIKFNVIEDFSAKIVVVELIDGGIDAREEDISLQAGDIITSESFANTQEPTEINITLESGDIITGVPKHCVDFEPIRPASGGCGGCAQKMKNRR